MKRILVLAMVSLLLLSTSSIFIPQVRAEDSVNSTTQSNSQPVVIRELTIPDRARVVDYNNGIYVVGTSNGDLYVINEAGEYTIIHLGDLMISDIRIKNSYIVVAANHIYDKGEYWYDTYHYRYASFDYGYVIKFTLSGLIPNEQWRTRIESWGYWSEGTWDGMSNTYQNFALPSVDLSSDGNYVAYLSHYDVGVLSGNDGALIASYSISGAAIVSWLDATDDMEYIAITAEVGPYYWGENTGVELYRFDGASLNRVWGTILIYRYETTEVKISEDKRYVAVATSSGTEMNLLDLATGNILWRYDATQEQFAVDGDRNLNYIIGATQYDPYVSPSPPYKWFIIHNLGTTFEVIAEGNMNGSINDLDSNDDASLLAFGSDAGEVILLRRTDSSVETVYNFNINQMIDSIEIGARTLFVGGEKFIHLYAFAIKGIRILQPEAGKIFWIQAEPEPTMPAIVARAEIYGAESITGQTEELTIRHIVWEAVCNYTAKVWTPDFTSEGKYAGHGHYEKFTFTHVFTKDVVVSQDAKEASWEIDWQNIICGGNLTIKVKTIIDGIEYQDSVTVYIRGKNPRRETVREALTDPEEPDKIALQVISYIESCFAQFFDTPWQRRNDYVAGAPLYGPPGGYGLMQIDVPPNHFWNKLLEKYDGNPSKIIEELRKYQNNLMWNWKFNIDEGKRTWQDLWYITLQLQKSMREKYGKEVKPLSEEQKENNTACLYNTYKHYYYWNTDTKNWGLTGYGIDYVNKFAEIKKEVLLGQYPEWWDWQSALDC